MTSSQLCRISQAHAKLMLRERVAVDDAIVTISLVESTMLTSSLLGSVSVLHSVFPTDPEREFQQQRAMVLELLDLPPTYGDDGAAGTAVGTCPPPIRPFAPRVRQHPLAEPTKIQKPATKKKRPPPPPPPPPPLAGPSETLKSEASSAAAPAPSFAELVRRHKLQKRNQPKVSPRPLVTETIDDMLAEDLSDILGGDQNTADQRENAAVQKENTADQSENPSDQRDQNTEPDQRENTAVAVMFNKFTSPTKDETEKKVQSEPPTNNLPQQHRTCVPAVDTERENRTLVPTINCAERENRTFVPIVNCAERENRTFVPIVNTQSCGMSSSGKENTDPQPPHFPLSPVSLEPPPHYDDGNHSNNGNHGNQIEVTKEELLAKTTKPGEQESVFHSESARKLQRFVFRSKNSS
eukprot:sb/3465211/